MFKKFLRRLEKRQKKQYLRIKFNKIENNSMSD